MKVIVVPVSGGKDSQAVLSLALKTGVAVVCVHQNTAFDHPFTYSHMEWMEGFYGVKIEHTHSKYGGMFGFLEHAQYFPNSGARGCTQRLKQEPFAVWLLENGFSPDNCEIWFGMRADESATRTSKYSHLTEEDEVPLCEISAFYGMKKWRPVGDISCRMPIVDWTVKEVFAHLHSERAEVNRLYEKGHHRVGCYPCLLSRKAEWQAAARDDTGQDHIQRMIELEEKWAKDGNPRKYIKVHKVWDVRKFMDGDAQDLPDLLTECSYCG